MQVSGKTVGVVGTGRIGAEFCTLLKVGACNPLLGRLDSNCSWAGWQRLRRKPVTPAIPLLPLLCTQHRL